VLAAELLEPPVLVEPLAPVELLAPPELLPLPPDELPLVTPQVGSAHATQVPCALQAKPAAQLAEVTQETTGAHSPAVQVWALAQSALVLHATVRMQSSCAQCSSALQSVSL
jgi:hypothetical protein